MCVLLTGLNFETHAQSVGGRVNNYSTACGCYSSTSDTISTVRNDTFAINTQAKYGNVTFQSDIVALRSTTVTGAVIVQASVNGTGWYQMNSQSYSVSGATSYAYTIATGNAVKYYRVVITQTAGAGATGAFKVWASLK